MGFRLSTIQGNQIQNHRHFLDDIERAGQLARLEVLLELVAHDVALARRIEQEALEEAAAMPASKADLTWQQERRFNELVYLRHQLHAGRRQNDRTNHPELHWRGETFIGLSRLEPAMADLQQRIERVRERQTVPA